MFGNKFWCLGLTILVVMISLCVSGAAQPITAPVVITSPGTYELTADARGIPDVYGIKIECSNVVVDGQGHFLGGDQRDKSVGVYVNQYGGDITNVSIKNLKLEDWDSAVSYRYVKGQEGDKNEITNLDIVDCLMGIHIEYSDIIQIIDNMIRDCDTAIKIEQNSNKVTLSENMLKNNGAGVIILKTVDVSLTDNNINTCEVYGVQVTDSTGFSMNKNSVSDNKYAALQIENSLDSIITDNNFSKTETGPVVVVGNGVTGADVYNNYFGSVENISVDEISSDITWNTTLETDVNILGGPYKGGNYWGSAPGLEGFSDTVADEDGFGIGDKPYEINSYNVDYLPLTNTDKNYPAPTPEPEETALTSESENQTRSDTNTTETNETVEALDVVIGESVNVTPTMPVNATETNETVKAAEVIIESPVVVAPSEPVNATEETVDNETETSISLPSTPVQNEYVKEESALSALGSAVVHVKDEISGNNTSQTSGNVSSKEVSSVKNGYLLFSGLMPGNQVVLVTSSGSEVSLDQVMTSSLSVPVPAGITLYSSWKVENNNQTLSSGAITRYPAADETVVINTSESTPVSISPTPVVPNETPGVTILTLSDLKDTNTSSVENSTILSNNTPTTVIPPVLTYLPKTTGAENSSGTESIVMMNTADGRFTPGHTITAYAGPGGAIFPEGTVEVMAEGNVTFVLTPYEGHQVDYLLIDGSAVNATPEYQFENVTQDHTIIAGFN